MQSSPTGEGPPEVAAAQVFVFNVIFEPWTGHDGETGGVQAGNGSVIVEVKPEKAPDASIFGASGESARQLAEEVAQWAALQAVQKDLPHGAAPACSVLLLTHLPDELKHRNPTFHTCQARSWPV